MKMDVESKKENDMAELQDRYIRFDWAIKRLLRQKANFVVLEGFLTVFLGEKITITEILESESNQQTVDDKFNRVDIKALNSKGEIIIVEIQNEREANFLERILYGVAKAITEHISLGERYDRVKKVYSISVLYFDLGKGTDYLYHGRNQFVGVHTRDYLQISSRKKDALVMRYPSDIFPEYILIRVNEFNKVAVSPLEEWMSYLKEGKIRPDTTAPGLREAREKLKYYSMTPAERNAYDRHLDDIMVQNDVMDTARMEGLAEGLAKGHTEGLAEGLAKGHTEGLAEGLAKGHTEGLAEGLAKGHTEGLAEGLAKGHTEGLAEGKRLQNIENARHLKRLGVPAETVSQATGLTLEEIEAL